MNQSRLNTSLRPLRNVRAGFTLIELLVVLAMIALLVLLQLPTLAKVTRTTKVAQCSSNLRQFTLAHHIYGTEFNDKLPVSSGGNWAWDLGWNAGLALNRYGAPQEVMYCPGTAPRFTDDDNEALYEYYAPGSIHVIGYVHTLPSSVGGSSLIATNVNSTLTPQTITSGPTKYPAPLPSQRVLAADATIQVNVLNGSFTFVLGGFAKPHTSPHLNGSLPAGGNLGMLDGHVEWRRFQDMQIRTPSSAAPNFWW
jgi:prepilin-type N-terminal cleavage/methylation domain-containing protein/prepilin-type processing-associated H-X9-DG protein